MLDKVHEISNDNVDNTHVFTLSQVYEGLLLKMGEKGNDGGQFFTPREIIRAMVSVIDPQDWRDASTIPVAAPADSWRNPSSTWPGRIISTSHHPTNLTR